MAELTFAKNSAAVTGDSKKNWPIADRLVASNDPRINGETQYGFSSCLRVRISPPSLKIRSVGPEVIWSKPGVKLIFKVPQSPKSPEQTQESITAPGKRDRSSSWLLIEYFSKKSGAVGRNAIGLFVTTTNYDLTGSFVIDY